MKVSFNTDMAARYGIKAATVAQLIWDKINSDNARDVHIKCFDIWFRCSALMMTGHLPFMSTHMIYDALGILLDNHILKKDCLNEDKFDHTNWYAFTPYGRYLMNGGDEKLN